MLLTYSPKYITFAYINGLTSDFAKVPIDREGEIAALAGNTDRLKAKYTDNQGNEYTKQEVMRAKRKQEGRKRANIPQEDLDNIRGTLRSNKDTLRDVRTIDRYEQQQRGTDVNLSRRNISEQEYLAAKDRLSGGAGISKARNVQDALLKMDEIRRAATPVEDYPVKGAKSLLGTQLGRARLIDNLKNNTPLETPLPSYINRDILATLDSNQTIPYRYIPNTPGANADTSVRRAAARVGRVLNDVGIPPTATPLPIVETENIQSLTERPTNWRYRLNQAKKGLLEKTAPIREQAKVEVGRARDAVIRKASKDINKVAEIPGNIIGRTISKNVNTPPPVRLPIPEPKIPVENTPTPIQPSVSEPKQVNVEDLRTTEIPVETPPPPSKPKRVKAKGEKPVLPSPSLEDLQDQINQIRSDTDTVPSASRVNVTSQADNPGVGGLLSKVNPRVARNAVVGGGALLGGLALLNTASSMANSQAEQARLKREQSQQGYLGYPGYNPQYPPTPQTY